MELTKARSYLSTITCSLFSVCVLYIFIPFYDKVFEITSRKKKQNLSCLTIYVSKSVFMLFIFLYVDYDNCIILYL